MERRKHQRRRVLWDAELRRENRLYSLRCYVFDISAGGARIRTEALLPLGMNVVLVIEEVGEFPGKVLWQRGNHTGIEFLEESWTVQMRLASAPEASVLVD